MLSYGYRRHLENGRVLRWTEKRSPASPGGAMVRSRFELDGFSIDDKDGERLVRGETGFL